MPNFWMVRAGEGGYLINDFERAGYVAVGFGNVGDFRKATAPGELRNRIVQDNPELSPNALNLSLGVATKFRDSLKRGDPVVSYDPEKREYLFGHIAGDYEYAPGTVPDYDHVRKVQWEKRFSRDALSPSSRNSLGSSVTLFEPGEEVLREIEVVLHRGTTQPPAPVNGGVVDEEFTVIWKDTLSRAHEFIKDRILLLSPDDMEALVAALLRAMGFRARVTPKGPDRGRDVVASPDGLGFQHPRIMSEVKHRPRETIGAQVVRGFIGALREDDRGLFVSTGGFTKEAHYEAERSTVPVSLVDLDDLARLVVEHYEAFDLEGRRLIPLVRVYWPVS
jgi:restriction system protein